MKKKVPNPHKENIIWMIIAIIAGIITEGYVMVVSRDIPLGELIKNIFLHINYLRIIFFEIVYLGVFVTIYVFNRKGKNLLDFIYKNRFAISGIILILCMIFQISGSSIGCWDDFLGYNTDNGILAGISRSIRSDEWSVFTPMMLAQVESNYEYTNDNFRGGAETDMFIIYGQPVKDISMIFRVFQIGYILFGASAGLSFYWCARFLALFLASFEFIMLITNKNKCLSFVGTVLIVFSTTIQWWYSINNLMEMIIFAELGIILLDKYFKQDNFKLRTLYMVVMAICVGSFALTFYPAWMVPITYMFLPFVIWVIIENRKNIKITKKDIIAFLIIALVFAGLMARILIKSWDVITTTTTTVYPNLGVSLNKGSGVEYINFILNSISTILTSIDNPCEITTMMDFWPIGLVFLVVYIFKEKKKDVLITMSLIVVLVLNVKSLFVIPEWLGKITLLSIASQHRICQVMGLLNIFILMRVLSQIEFKFKNKWAVIISVIISVLAVMIARYYYPQRISLIIAVVLMIMFAFVFYTILMFNQKKKLFTTTIVIFMLSVSSLVNPIRSGLNLVEDNPLLKAIEQINTEDEGLWAVVEVGLPEINLPPVVGAKNLNTTNTYPNLELWNKIDEDKEYEDVYNRYSHIYITLVDNSEQTKFELLNMDVIRIFITYEDFKELGVKYIIRGTEFVPYDTTNEDFDLEEKYKDENYVIYEIL